MRGTLFNCIRARSVISGQMTVKESIYREHKLSDILKNINLTLR